MRTQGTVKTTVGTIAAGRESLRSFIRAWYAWVESVCDDPTEPREYVEGDRRG